MPAGYSGTPLHQKLGVKDGQRTWHLNTPPAVLAEILATGLRPHLVAEPTTGLEMAHLFVTRRAELAARLAELRPLMAPAGALWISWPKKASRQPTDITEDTIRAEALPLGFVDIKVCAIDATWSGLKLVIRKSERQPPQSTPA